MRQSRGAGSAYLGVGGFLVAIVLLSAAGGSAQSGADQRGQDPQLPPQAEAPATMSVRNPISHGRSAPLRDYVKPEAPGADREAPEVRSTGERAKPPSGGGGGGKVDSVKQTVYPTSIPPVTLASFAGITYTGSVPPDTNVAVGPTQVVEVVNSHYAVYSKAGDTLLGPFPMYQMFASMTGDDCSWRAGSDPIVLFDRLAGRWLVARYLFAPNFLCVAVSQTDDATGVYHLYNFSFGPNTADYPKFGVWPDAYYFTANTFSANNGPFIGAQACAFDRNAMLTGLPNATVICYQGSTSWHSLLPSDLDSALPPPAGSPNYFMQYDTNQLSLYKFRPDFATPALSTFTGPTAIPVAKFTPGCGACIPQPGVTEKLESLASRLMYRLSYRNFGSYESLLANHAVQVQLSGNSTQTGIRWYEIRTPNGTPTVYQQSTYSPDTTTYRWMGSIAQDKLGNMFLGYSASSSTVYPSIRFAARLETDPLNQMQVERSIKTGTGSQIPKPGQTRDRWGDYASVAVDPVDGCTLWFATEYLSATGYDQWITHLYSAKFNGCS